MNDCEFPTGKDSVSYSEIACWADCAYRHKLTYVDKVPIEFKENEHTSFGHALHSSIESYLKTRVIDRESCLLDIENKWKSLGRDDVDKWKLWASNILDEIPGVLDREFGGWELIGSEIRLFGDVPGIPIKFKGFVDCVIKVKDSHGREKIVVIDWKTGPAYGWRREKRESFLVQLQLILYKIFVMRMLSTSSRETPVVFVVMKKGAKPGKVIDIIRFSAGPKTQARAEKSVRDMVKSVQRRLFLKNKYNCQHCDYRGTPHCTR